MKSSTMLLGLIVLLVVAGGGIGGLTGVVDTGVVDGGTAIQGAGGGLNVYATTPQVEPYGVDEITGISAAGSGYEVTMAGVKNAYVANAGAVQGAIGDAVTIKTRPNSTYYDAFFSGTLQKNIQKVELKRLKQGTATIWINNDPENSTVRNAVGAPDTLGASDSDYPTVCVQGATNYASFGNKKFLVSVDFNSTNGNTVSLNKGTLVGCPGCHAKDSNNTASICYEVTGQMLRPEDTWCATMTFTNGATDEDSGHVSSPRVKVYDDFVYIDSATSDIAKGYFTTTCGDTNSATNPTAVTYWTG